MAKPHAAFCDAPGDRYHFSRGCEGCMDPETRDTPGPKWDGVERPIPGVMTRSQWNEVHAATAAMCGMCHRKLPVNVICVPCCEKRVPPLHCSSYTKCVGCPASTIREEKPA
jgi:hypothetical protein